MQSLSRGWMVLALFFCSGATALVYELVWSKFLAQMFGSTIYAQTVVLAVFMGGLALGNRLFGRWADRLRQPVQAYGCLEISIGVYALLFPTLDGLADHVFVTLGTHIAERTGLLLSLKGVLSATLLLGPAILMGGTLPLMAAWLQKSSGDPGRGSARFYAVNSLGAVVGSALAGFWLVQQFGMVGTLRVTATVNVILGLTAVALSRLSSQKQSPFSKTAPAIEPDSAAPDTLRWAGVIVALTGAVSMGLELLSARSLALIFGSSLQSFAVVLIAFILGIGLGSAWVAAPRRQQGPSEQMIVLLLCYAAVWVALLVFNIERWVDFYRIARTGLGRTEVGYVYQQLLNTGISLVILGVPATCIGAVLPIMIRAVSVEGTPLGAKVGALLTWNTLGAVVGTLFTGFVLLPWVGLRNAFGVLALVLGLVACLVAWRRRWRLGIASAVAVCALVGTLFLSGEAGWRHVMSAGMFRVWETSFDPKLLPLRKQHTRILFYEDAPDATVSVERDDAVIAKTNLFLRINGKPDAGTDLDIMAQLLVAHLPMLVKPAAKDVFVLGLGSGMTAGALLAYPIERIVMAENCEPVIRASKYFAGWNHNVLEDPRIHVWREDARTVLKLKSQRYDVIINEPSNPWTVGVGSVFSREFYELAASRLKPGGIVAQWFHLYEVDDEIVELVLRTYKSVFPFVEVWDTGAGDIVMLGAAQPWSTGPEVFRPSFAIERVRGELEMIGLRSPEALLGRQIASQQTGFAIAGDGAVQSDLFPVLEYAAPRAFYLGAGSRLLDRFDERTRQQLLAPAAKRAALRSLPMASAQNLFSTYSTVNEELYGSLSGNPSSASVPCAFQTPQPAPAPGAAGTTLDQAAAAFEAGAFDQAEQLIKLALQKNPGDAQAGYLARVVTRARQLRPASGNPRAAR